MKELAYLVFCFSPVMFGAALAADISVISGLDPMTDATYQGIEIKSENGGATVTFLCHNGEKTPYIVFTHQTFLSSAGQRVNLEYRIDGGKRSKRTLIVNPGNTSGRYYPDYFHEETGLAMYKALGGARGPRFKKIGQWQASRGRLFVEHFLKGRNGLIRVWDSSGQSFTYKFDLSDIGRFRRYLSPCY